MCPTIQAAEAAAEEEEAGNAEDRAAVAEEGAGGDLVQIRFPNRCGFLDHGFLDHGFLEDSGAACQVCMADSSVKVNHCGAAGLYGRDAAFRHPWVCFGQG